MSKRIKAGEKEVADLVARVADRKKALAKLDKELAKVKEGRWQRGWVGAWRHKRLAVQELLMVCVGGQVGGH